MLIPICFGGLWSAKKRTVVEMEENFGYIYRALASWRLRSLHRSSDTHRARRSRAGLPGRAKTNI
jgi:hypothetical protein